MNNGGDAAEQVVRLSLEGFEVAARLSGSAAKNIALLLVSVLKQEQKTKGKARLTNMIKSGKELKFFPSQQLLTDFHRFFHSHFHKGNGTGQYQYSQQSNTVKTMECFTAQQQAVK